MQLYDNASNGNKTRGNMKKAQDLYVYSQCWSTNTIANRDQDHTLSTSLSRERRVQEGAGIDCSNALDVLLLTDPATRCSVPARKHPR